MRSERRQAGVAQALLPLAHLPPGDLGDRPVAEPAEDVQPVVGFKNRLPRRMQLRDPRLDASDVDVLPRDRADRLVGAAATVQLIAFLVDRRAVLIDLV
ncbi:hypothetical protein [Micromonospora coerulea]|uniref:hypothetical protein n=1 Tax=Micromonospora coerulea TaxID=47856 RepID=UPI0019073AAD|nr:hypothetical protein [Micromonospora veneta]